MLTFLLLVAGVVFCPAVVVLLVEVPHPWRAAWRGALSRRPAVIYVWCAWYGLLTALDWAMGSAVGLTGDLTAFVLLWLLRRRYRIENGIKPRPPVLDGDHERIP